MIEDDGYGLVVPIDPHAPPSRAILHQEIH